MDLEEKIKYLAVLKPELNKLKDEIASLEIDIATELANKDEGTTTNEDKYRKVTIKTTINRGVDQEEAAKLREVIPVEEFEALFPAKYTLSKSAFNKLNDNQKLIISKAITSKPGKPSVNVELFD